MSKLIIILAFLILGCSNVETDSKFENDLTSLQEATFYSGCINGVIVAKRHYLIQDGSKAGVQGLISRCKDATKSYVEYINDQQKR